MIDGNQHDPTACSRAWQTLRLAHDRVAHRLEADLAHECTLAINEFDVLLYLRTHPDEPTRITALLEAVPLSQPALSRLVARLAERGLLQRSPAGDDRRASLVCLTDTGTTLIDRAIVVHTQAVHAALTSKFTDEEQAALLRILSQIGQ
jgi:DNA-binding MarR family transcriptional regulator